MNILVLTADDGSQTLLTLGDHSAKVATRPDKWATWSAPTYHHVEEVTE